MSAWPRGRLGSWGHAEPALRMVTAPVERPVPTRVASPSRASRPVLISRTIMDEVGARPDLSSSERLRESPRVLVTHQPMPPRGGGGRGWPLALVRRPLLASGGRDRHSPSCGYLGNRPCSGLRWRQEQDGSRRREAHAPAPRDWPSPPRRRPEPRSSCDSGPDLKAGAAAPAMACGFAPGGSSAWRVVGTERAARLGLAHHSAAERPGPRGRSLASQARCRVLVFFPPRVSDRVRGRAGSAAFSAHFMESRQVAGRLRAPAGHARRRVAAALLPWTLDGCPRPRPLPPSGPAPWLHPLARTGAGGPSAVTSQARSLQRSAVAVCCAAGLVPVGPRSSGRQGRSRRPGSGGSSSRGNARRARRGGRKERSPRAAGLTRLSWGPCRGTGGGPLAALPVYGWGAPPSPHWFSLSGRICYKFATTTKST